MSSGGPRRGVAIVALTLASVGVCGVAASPAGAKPKTPHHYKYGPGTPRLPLPGNCDQLVDKILIEQKLDSLIALQAKDENGKPKNQYVRDVVNEGMPKRGPTIPEGSDPLLQVRSFKVTTVTGYVFKGELPDGTTNAPAQGDFTILDPNGAALLTYNLDVNADHLCAVKSVNVFQREAGKTHYVTVDKAKCDEVHALQRKEAGPDIETLKTYLRAHRNEQLLGNACGPAAFTLMLAPYGGPDPAVLANALKAIPPAQPQIDALVQKGKDKIDPKPGEPKPFTNVNEADPTADPNLPVAGSAQPSKK